jgi:hypothetical protein
MIATASHKGKGDGTPTPKMERTQRISEGTEDTADGEQKRTDRNKSPWQH